MIGGRVKCKYQLAFELQSFSEIFSTTKEGAPKKLNR